MKEKDSNLLNLYLGEKLEKKKKTSFFYQVENHQELFKIGASYLKDYDSGIKSFAIGSIACQSSQQKTIMGLASFFDHQKDLKIGIVTESLKDNYFSKIIDTENSHKAFLSEKTSFTITTFHNHYDFLILDEVMVNEKRANDDNDDNDEVELINDFLDSYDIIFWDVPEIHKIQTSPQHYLNILERFESLSLIVAQSSSKKEEIDHIISFFSDYGVALKGLLMDEDEAEQKPRKRLFGGL